MKKIKLFLITLLCMVGVMNVDAQGVITDSPYTQNVHESTGSLNGNTWTSNVSYDNQGNKLTIADDASLNIGMTFNNSGDVVFRIWAVSINGNDVTIKAPDGWFITGYSCDLDCNNAKVVLKNGVEFKSSGPMSVPVVDAVDTRFRVIFDGGIDHTLTFRNFKVYLKKNEHADDKVADKFYDSNGHLVVDGAMYAISVEQRRQTDWLGLFFDYTDYYFSQSGNVVTAGTAWPANAEHFVNEDAAWEVASLSDGRFTLQNAASGKYLENKDNDATPTAETKSGSLKYTPGGDYTSANKTPHFYSLQFKDNNGNTRYLNWNEGNQGNALNFVNSVSLNDNKVYKPKFRFHRIDYVRLGVYTEKNGILEPLDYSVEFNIADDPKTSTTPNTLYDKHGQTLICYEHNENSDHTKVIRGIDGRILGVDVDEEPDEYELQILVNGVKTATGTTINDVLSEFKSGASITIIYKLPDGGQEGGDTEDAYAGAFYRLKSKVNNKYLSVNESVETVNGNKVRKFDLVTDGEYGDNSIFYHDGTTLLSYTSGVYVLGNKAAAIEEMGSGLQLVRNTRTTDIQADNQGDIRIGEKYLTSDNGGGSVPGFAFKPSAEYTLEVVEELPVVLNTVGAHRYGTFYAPVDVTVPEGLEAYRVDGITPGAATTDPDVLGLVHVTEIPANTGVILYEEAVSETEYALTITSDVVDVNSLLDGVCPRRIVKENETLYGLNKKTINGKETAGFYKMKTGSALSPFRAFLDYTESEQGESKGFVFSFTEADAIEAIEMSHAEVAIYDLQGRKVQNPGTGIYIVNGKKIMIRK